MAANRAERIGRASILASYISVEVIEFGDRAVYTKIKSVTGVYIKIDINISVEIL